MIDSSQTLLVWFTGNRIRVTSGKELTERIVLAPFNGQIVRSGMGDFESL